MKGEIAIPVSGDDVSEFNPAEDIVVMSIVPSGRIPSDPKWKIHMGRTIIKKDTDMPYSHIFFYSSTRRSIEAAYKERKDAKRGFVLLFNGKARHIMPTYPATWDSPELYSIDFDSDIIESFPIATKEELIEYNNFNLISLGGVDYPVYDYVVSAARPMMSSVIGGFTQIGGYGSSKKRYFEVLGIPDFTILSEEKGELYLQIYEISYKFNSVTKTCWVEKRFADGTKEYYIGNGDSPSKLESDNLLSLERKQ